MRFAALESAYNDNKARPHYDSKLKLKLKLKHKHKHKHKTRDFLLLWPLERMWVIRARTTIDSPERVRLPDSKLHLLRDHEQ